MPINSKDKGKRGERAWKEMLEKYGWEARRTGFHQSQQGHDAPDVTCEALPAHWEVKSAKKCLIGPWMDQAANDAKPYQMPIVAWKPDRKDWVVMLNAEYLLILFQNADLKAVEERLQINKNNKTKE